VRRFLRQMRDAMELQLHVRVLRDPQVAPSTIYTKQVVQRAYLAKYDGCHFRIAHCYSDQMEKVLRRHEASLQVIFKVYAEGLGGIASDLGHHRSKALGLDEFTSLVYDLSLIGPDLSIRRAMQEFVSSRMRVIDELECRSRAKLFNLSFEDFLEVLVRLADCKVWPTDAEVQTHCAAVHGAPCAPEDLRWHCAELVFLLQRDATAAAYATFAAAPRAQPPVWDKMESLILLIVHHIDENHDKAVADKEVRRFIRRAGASEQQGGGGRRNKSAMKGASGLVSMH
jgi:hypothetical protein